MTRAAAPVASAESSIADSAAAVATVAERTLVVRLDESPRCHAPPATPEPTAWTSSPSSAAVTTFFQVVPAGCAVAVDDSAARVIVKLVASFAVTSTNSWLSSETSRNGTAGEPVVLATVIVSPPMSNGADCATL